MLLFQLLKVLVKIWVHLGSDLDLAEEYDSFPDAKGVVMKVICFYTA